MATQSHKNHSRYIPLWHVITPLLILAILGGSIVNLIHADEHSHYSAALICVISIVLILVYWYARWFALRAQDRAIRAEENFRYYVLSGNPFPKELRMGQIIALRFAPDEEFVQLAKRAVSEQLTTKQIKEAIRNWKGDYHRV
jgi:hypothetical protein